MSTKKSAPKKAPAPKAKDLTSKKNAKGGAVAAKFGYDVKKGTKV